MKSKGVLLLALFLGLCGCVAPPAAAPPPPPTISPPPPAAAAPAQQFSLQGRLRHDLGRRWFQGSNHSLRWPGHDGFAGTPIFVTLQPGILIDRYGGDGGNFFSPKGASFAARALPYVCENEAYTSYQLLKPLPAWIGKAAPWFNEKGGATQIKTDATAAMLVSDQVIAVFPHRDLPSCKPES